MLAYAPGSKATTAFEHGTASRIMLGRETRLLPNNIRCGKLNRSCLCKTVRLPSFPISPQKVWDDRYPEMQSCACTWDLHEGGKKSKTHSRYFLGKGGPTYFYKYLHELVTQNVALVQSVASCGKAYGCLAVSGILLLYGVHHIYTAP
jgi:hypothetical protein